MGKVRGAVMIHLLLVRHCDVDRLVIILLKELILNLMAFFGFVQPQPLQMQLFLVIIRHCHMKAVIVRHL